MKSLLSSSAILLSLILSGLTLTSCSSYSKLRQQASESPLMYIENQTPSATITEADSSGPLVRYPELPVKESASAEQKSQPQTQPVPEVPAEPPQQLQPPQEKPQQKPAAKEKASQPAAVNSRKTKQLTLSQLYKKYPNLLLLKGSAHSKKIALTFDDAPDTLYTPQVLNILKRYDVKATFFIVGQLAEKHPAMVKRISREGHIIGNHTYNHPLLTKLSDDQYQTQVNKTQRTLRALIGYTPKLLRPPYGEISESQLLWASSHRLQVVNWNIDSLDWKQLDQQQVTSNVLSRARAGSIILQHSGGGPNQNLSGTVNALPEIIESLQSQGYNLVTLPDLLNVPKQI